MKNSLIDPYLIDLLQERQTPEHSLPHAKVNLPLQLERRGTMIFKRGLSQQFVDALNRAYQARDWWRQYADAIEQRSMFIGTATTPSTYIFRQIAC